MTARKGDSKEQVADEILEYLLENPAIADSLTGIARWRLLQQTVKRSVEATESALQLLVARGYVVEVPRATGERLFQLNSAKQNEAESFLRQRKHERGRSRIRR